MSLRNPRNHRYAETPSAGRTSSVVTLWRWRSEIVLLGLAVVLVLMTVNMAAGGNWWSFLMLAGAVSAPAATRFGRGWITGHFWCLFSRHRIQTVCLETPMHTRAGRIPLVLWITPTPTGEKALILTRAGICAEDFEAFAGEIEAACLARRVVVARHRRHASLVTVEVVRRDAAAGTPAGLDRLYGTSRWVSLPSTRDLEEPPDLRTTLLLPQAG
ncbi:hypothetical protein [Streptosporangium sp. KLBMP 9127]|nr:hypothetical protein [Streptosporangium sp. KLBMP 9127]